VAGVCSYRFESEGLSLRPFCVIFAAVFCFTGRLVASFRLDADGAVLLAAVLVGAATVAAEAIICVVVSGEVVQDLPRGMA
jgi:hypothetical protein